MERLLTFLHSKEARLGRARARVENTRQQIHEGKFTGKPTFDVSLNRDSNLSNHFDSLKQGKNTIKEIIDEETLPRLLRLQADARDKITMLEEVGEFKPYISSVVLDDFVRRVADSEPRFKQKVADVKPDDHRKEGSKFFEHILPDGQMIKVKGKHKSGALAVLIASYPKAKESKDLAIDIFGDDSKRSRDRVSSIIKSLEKDVQVKKWHIEQPVKPQDRAKRMTARYELQKIDETEKMPPADSPNPIEGLSGNPAGESVEKKGVAQEAYLTSVVLDTARVDTKTVGDFKFVNYCNIQASIVRADDIKDTGGRMNLDPYPGQKLAETVTEFLSRLSQESRRPKFRQQWTPEEKQVWETFQEFQQQVSARYPGALIKRIGKEIYLAHIQNFG